MKAFSVFLAALFSASSSEAQDLAWNDGAYSAVQHDCMLGLDDVGSEDLEWTWVGYQGLPETGSVYYVRIMMGGLGCSGAWVHPELKLPRATSLAIDAQHPVLCYGGPSNALAQLSDCPQQPQIGLYPDGNDNFPNATGSGVSNNYYGFSPTDQSVWPLPGGDMILVDVPVISSETLTVFSDYVLGAVLVFDNNPGGPSSQWNGASASFNGSGLPDAGPYEGVEVTAGPDTSLRLAYPQPSAINIAATTATLCAHVFNSGCLANQNLVFNITYADGGDGSEVAGAGHVTTIDGGLQACEDWTGLTPNKLWAWTASFQSTSGCSAGAIDPSIQNFQTPPSVAPPLSYQLLATNQGDGSVTLTPPDGRYDPSTTVSAQATPNAGSNFSSWLLDGASVSGPNPLSVDMSAGHTLVARFVVNGGGSSGGGSASSTGGGASSAGSSSGSSAGAAGGTTGNSIAPPNPPDNKKGCNANGNAAWALVLAALCLRRRRER